MKIKKSQLRRIIREEIQRYGTTAEPWVVIKNLGRGVQRIWPELDSPGVYSESEAQKIAREQQAFSKETGETYAYWHAQPLRLLPGNRVVVDPDLLPTIMQLKADNA